MQDSKTGADVGMRLARERLFHRNEKSKPAPLCLACGDPATNELPSCSAHKRVKTVRPVYRWAHRVAALATTNLG